jgi:hypothetical protein
MFCTQCGASADAAAKFCSKCGTALGGQTQSPPVTTTPTSPETKSLSVVWVYLAAIAWVGACAAVLIPAFAGQRPTQQGTGIVLWTALLVGLLWKRRGRNGWIGALIGAAIGFGLYILAAVIGGSVNATS